MRRRNKYIILATLVFLAVGALLGRYAYSQGFTKKWRQYISGEFAKRGVYLEFEKLTMDPVRGLVAREVTLFGDESRTRMLAKINHITLDVDYAGLLGKEMFLDSFDLKDADLFFQLDPDNPKGERLRIRNFSARVFLTGDRIQIRRAEGLVNGIDVSLRGLFFNAGSEGGGQGGEPPAGGGAQDSPSFQTKDLSKFVRWLRGLKFDRDSPPQMEIAIHGGNLQRPGTLHGAVHFVGRDLKIGSYACESIEAILEMRRGTAVLKRFTLIDSSGRLDANAEYHFGDPSVRFHIESEADLRGFLLDAMDWHPLASVVSYESPKISADGELFLRPFDKAAWPPVRAVGKISCGKIMARGRIFESAQTDFSIEPDRFYLRNAVIEHPSGGFSGEAMFDSQGFRYRANLTLDPREFLPFCEQPSTRELLQRFEFSRESLIFAEITGAGSDLDPVNWENEAEFELRNFEFDGVEFRKFEGRLDLATGIQTYRKIEIAHGEGESLADLVRVDPVNEIVEIRNYRGNVDMAEVMRCFDIAVTSEIRVCNFREPPQVSIDGILDIGSNGRNDLKIRVDAPGGMDYEVGGQPLPFEEVNAGIHVLGNVLDIKVGCALFGGGVDAELKVEMNASATVVEGKESGEEDAKEIEVRNTFSGHVEFDDVRFGEFIRVYSPGAESGGKLAGEFDFSEFGSDIEKFEGHGTAELEGGDLFVLPCLRTLSAGLAKELRSLPKEGYGVASKASASISLSGGLIGTDDFEAETSAFLLRLGGVVDLLGDRVSLKADTDIRGGLRFKGSGSVLETEWDRENR